MAQQEMQIYLYNDEGVNEDCFLSTIEWLKNRTSLGKLPIKVVPITAKQIKEGILDDKPDAFFIPGGSAPKYSETLKGEGVQKIRDYVEEGGLLQGICAGAYFSAEEFYYNNPKGQETDLNSERGETTGAAHVKATGEPDLRQEKIDDGCQLIVSYKVDGKEHKTQVYYNKGPHLTPLKDDVKHTTLYKDLYSGKIAVAENKHGKGMVVVSGVHPEIDVEWMDDHDTEIYGEKLFDDPKEQQKSIDQFGKEVVLTHLLDRYHKLDKEFTAEQTAQVKGLNEKLEGMKSADVRESVNPPAPAVTPKPTPQQQVKPQQVAPAPPKPPKI